MTRAAAGEAWWFAGATGVAVVHALDDAVIHRQPGVPADQHLLAASITVALAAGAVVAFGRLRPGLRSLLALGFGVLTLANAGQHVAHIAVDAPARSDVTGVPAAVAGLALLALALWIPFRHRGEGASSPGRRWANRAVALVGGLATLYVVVLPVAVAVVSTHKHREPVGAPPSAAYRPVTFAAGDDGLSAVVGEGATAESLADVRDGGTSGVDLPYWAVLYAAARVLSGTSPAPALEELVPRVAPTPLLLIAAGGDRLERRFNRRYAAVARAPFALWEVPGGAHTQAIRERAAEYERRVIGFFDRRLHVGPAGRPRAGSGG
jgi:hypothetical protein